MIPLMSDDPERSFSSGRDLITYRRSNLHDDIIEACSCLRSWYGPPVQARASKAGEAAFDDEDEIEEQYKGLFTDNTRGTSDANGNSGQGDHQTNKQTDALEILFDKQLGKGSRNTYSSTIFFRPSWKNWASFQHNRQGLLHICILVWGSSVVYTRNGACTRIFATANIASCYRRLPHRVHRPTACSRDAAVSTWLHRRVSPSPEQLWMQRSQN